MVSFLCCFCFVLWNRRWSWCYFILRILQTGNRNKAILTVVIGLKNILRQNLVKSVLDKEDKSVPVYTLLFNFVCLFVCLQLQCVMCLLNYLLCLWIIRHVCNCLIENEWKNCLNLLRNIDRAIVCFYRIRYSHYCKVS